MNTYGQTYKTQQKLKRKTIKKKKFSLESFFVFIFCFILLFYVFPYSYKTYIKDVFPSKTVKYLDINYEKTMYPAQTMLPKEDTILGKYLVAIFLAICTLLSVLISSTNIIS